MDQPGSFNWSAQSPLELEEGELMEEVSDDDYSPGSLVIDHIEQGMYVGGEREE